jgi:Uma2 family endonuclease
VIVPWAGRSSRHNFLSGALIGELRIALRGKPCHVFTSDQRVSAAREQRYVFPDAAVVCGGVRLEQGTTDVLANPMIIVEVLSSSTEKFDRGDKWAAYQRLESLQDYLLVAQAEARMEHFQRQSDGSWRYLLVETGGVIVLSNGARLTIDDIYAGAFEVPGD